MSDDQHASNPGAAGSATSQVSTKARIQLTPAQYYARLAAAFVIGAAIGGGLAFLVGRLADEPPIKVRGGGLDIELGPGATWEDDGTNWKVKSNGWNPLGNYNFGIVIGENDCRDSGTPPPKVKRLTLEYGGRTYTIRRHVTALFKTKVEPKGHFTIADPQYKKILTNPNTTPLKVIAKPTSGKDWVCTFEAGTFQELCLDHKQPCM